MSRKMKPGCKEVKIIFNEKEYLKFKKHCAKHRYTIKDRLNELIAHDIKTDCLKDVSIF